ncbi:hypothetical protein [Pseudomonas sp. 30_B]|uniref:hypothetical protein n=1 Tax=Pseudomonas sp. 30_B TaxID=2813575 RepID=UPI001A9EACEA|nr:hypothetical protein [Pseudomonas sp. 30_B]
MDARTLVLCLACFLLVLSGFVFGYKFLKKRNYLLGVECLVIAFSASNALIFFLTNSGIAYEISHFLDAFSRGFGVPIISIIGLMAVTHGYKPSKSKDFLMFVVTFAATFVLILADFMVKPLPYFYIAMWSLFSIYLVYFASRLVVVGAYLQALGVIIAMLAGQAIASIYDFYKIPGDETNVVLNFYVLALSTWAFMLSQFYYGYGALERLKGSSVMLPAR